MSVICFYDTETDGVTDPRLVQLGMILDDRNGNTRAQIDIIIQPEGFEIPKEASDIHGIITEIAMAYGVPLKVALSIFNNTLRRADIVCGHNVSFDFRVMRREFAAINQACALDTMGNALTTVCTAELTKPICKLPPTPKMVKAGRLGFKTPKLTEAHSHFFGEDFQDSHSALADTMACRRIYYHLTALEALDQDHTGTRRYFYHPESDSLFTSDDGEEQNDGLVHEITEAQYNALRAQRQGEAHV